MRRICFAALCGLFALWPMMAGAITIEELKAHVQALMTQISTIQTQSAVPATAVVSCPSLSRSLLKGSRGPDVASLQTYLIAQGLLPVGNNSGYFGALTEAAVKSWQTKNGVVASGSAKLTGYGAVGPKTRLALYTQCGGAPPAVGCVWNGERLDNGTTVTAYKTQTVSADMQCETEVRKCDNGKLSGSYAYATCSFAAEGGCVWNGQVVANGSAVLAYQASTVAYGGQCVSEMRSCTWGALSGTYEKASCAVLPNQATGN